MIRTLVYRFLRTNKHNNNFPWQKYYGLLFRHANREKLLRAIRLGDFDKEIRRSILTICFHSNSPLLRAWYLFLEYDSFSVTSAGQPIVPWNYHSCRKMPSVDELHETSGVACRAKGERLFSQGEKEEAIRLLNLAKQYKFPE
jgi:hypothetical protein